MDLTNGRLAYGFLVIILQLSGPGTIQAVQTRAGQLLAGSCCGIEGRARLQ